MAKTRERFATQVNSEILKAVRTLAEKEGRRLEALVEELLPTCSKSTRSPIRANKLWTYISLATTNTAPFTRNSLNDGLPHGD